MAFCTLVAVALVGGHIWIQGRPAGRRSAPRLTSQATYVARRGDQDLTSSAKRVSDCCKPRRTKRLSFRVCIYSAGASARRLERLSLLSAVATVINMKQTDV
jgi:hypothetical protein